MTHNSSDSDSGTNSTVPSAAPNGLDLHNGVGVHHTTDAVHIEQGLEVWEHIFGRVSVLLRVGNPDGAWMQDFAGLANQVRTLALQDPDLALFVLIQSNATQVDHYSEQHAMACLVICELAGQWMEWPEEERLSLALAALSMNLSMTTLQDTLAERNGPLSESQRARVDGHAALSADLLSAAGVSNMLWLDVVRHHHTVYGPQAASAQEPTPRLAELLRRVDIYLAKLSQRGARESVTPAKAARDACLDSAGHPDSIGATLLRVIGLYPPGTYVELANGETGVVIKRGDKAHTPLVASVRRHDWGLIKPPQLRETSRPSFTVKRGVEPGHVRVLFDHFHLLACK